MKWRMISYLGFHVVRRCIFTLTCIFKHHKKKPMKVKLFRPRVVGTHPKSQCLASQAATQGAFSQKDPGNHRHHRGPVGLGGWLFPPKKMGGFPIGIDPFFQGIPKIFRGWTGWLLVSGRVKLRKKTFFGLDQITSKFVWFSKSFYESVASFGGHCWLPHVI